MADQRFLELIAEGCPEAYAQRIVDLESNLARTIVVAERVVLDAIRALRSHWSVPCKLDELYSLRSQMKRLYSLHDQFLEQACSRDNGQGSDSKGARTFEMVHCLGGHTNEFSPYTRSSACTDAHRLGGPSYQSYQGAWRCLKRYKGAERLCTLVLELNLLTALVTVNPTQR